MYLLPIELSQSLHDTFYTFNSTKCLTGGKNNKSWKLTDASVGVQLFTIMMPHLLDLNKVFHGLYLNMVIHYLLALSRPVISKITGVQFVLLQKGLHHQWFMMQCTIYNCCCQSIDKNILKVVRIGSQKCGLASTRRTLFTVSFGSGCANISNMSIEQT